MNDGQSYYNHSSLLRKFSMVSLAKTINIVDDEASEEINLDEMDFDDPSSFIYSMDENCFGNIEISLYWEEKILIVVRYM